MLSVCYSGCAPCIKRLISHLAEADRRMAVADHNASLAEAVCSLGAHSLLREGRHMGRRCCR